MRSFTLLVALALTALAPLASAIEDPRTTQIKADVAAFCSSLNGRQGDHGKNCFDISGAFFSAILAAKVKSPCDRTVLAQEIIDNFSSVQPAAAAELATKMANAPLNVIPPAQLPGPNPPCDTPLRVVGTSATPPSVPAASAPAASAPPAPEAPPASAPAAPPAPNNAPSSSSSSSSSSKKGRCQTRKRTY
ncbi:hypothetical protein HDU86_002675 [Geranomyces michiganensis]|nr:hypothetical protein HDU86_002675 [Geranomyces michiganensis]